MSSLKNLAEPPCDMEYIRLRCREEGECWMWAGAAKQGRWPLLALRRVGIDGVKRDFMLYVRHIVYWLKCGKHPALGGGKVLRTSCEHDLCVNPKHLKMDRLAEINRKSGHQRTLASRISMSLARRKRSKLSDEAVQEIRASDRPRKELAEQYGITHEYVRQLQLGEWRKEYAANPFAGLLAANDGRKRVA